MSHAVAAAVSQRAGDRPLSGPLLTVLGLAAVAVAVFASLILGASTIAPADVILALLAFDGSAEHVAVVEVRLPRSVVALAVGASLGVAGALMQAVGRNELADPTILGISWGAALATVAGQITWASTRRRCWSRSRCWVRRWPPP